MFSRPDRFLFQVRSVTEEDTFPEEDNDAVRDEHFRYLENHCKKFLHFTSKDTRHDFYFGPVVTYAEDHHYNFVGWEMIWVSSYYHDNAKVFVKPSSDAHRMLEEFFYKQLNGAHCRHEFTRLTKEQALEEGVEWHDICWSVFKCVLCDKVVCHDTSG